MPNTREDRAHCVDAEDDRQRGLLGGLHEGQRGPCPLERMCGEAWEAAQRDGAGAAGVVRDLLAREEGVAQCNANPVGR